MRATSRLSSPAWFGAAEDDVLDLARIDARALGEGAQRIGPEVVGANRGQDATVAPDRCPHRSDDPELRSPPSVSSSWSPARSDPGAAGVGVLQQLADVALVGAARVVGRHLLEHEARRLVEIVLAHADVAQRGGRTDAQRERLDRRRGVAALLAQRARDALGHVRQLGGVERRRVRQDDGVQVGVRQVVGTAEHVADLVVDRRARHGERRARQVRAVQRVGPAAEVLGALDRDRHALRERADALLGRERGDRVRARRVERLDAVRHRVDRARAGDEGRQRDGQLGVVDDDLRQHAAVVAGLLARAGRHAPHGRHLRALRTSSGPRRSAGRWSAR